jgi:hypothetical protein
MANTSILAAFERMWQHVVVRLNNKSDIDHTHSEFYSKEDAVLRYDEQTLTDEQKQQAQDNIGFSEVDALELVMSMNLVSPTAAEDGSIYTDENGALYSL